MPYLQDISSNVSQDALLNEVSFEDSQAILGYIGYFSLANSLSRIAAGIAKQFACLPESTLECLNTFLPIMKGISGTLYHSWNLFTISKMSAKQIDNENRRFASTAYLASFHFKLLEVVNSREYKAARVCYSLAHLAITLSIKGITEFMMINF